MLSPISGHFWGNGRGFALCEQRQRSTVCFEAPCKVLRSAEASLFYFGLKCPSCELILKSQLSSITPHVTVSSIFLKWEIYFFQISLLSVLHVSADSGPLCMGINDLLMRQSGSSLFIISLTFNHSLQILVTISFSVIGCYFLTTVLLWFDMKCSVWPGLG